jgi:hypothetical protein
VRHNPWLRVGLVMLFVGTLLSLGPAALADRHDHHGGGEHGQSSRIVGLITAFDLASASGSGTVTGQVYSNQPSVGTLTVTTAANGSVTAAILADAEVQAPASALAQGFVGQMASVWLRDSGAGTVVTRVEVQPKGEDEGALRLTGTVVSVTPPSGGTPGSLTVTTNNGSEVTVALDPNVVVKVGDRDGTVQDLTPGADVKVFLAVSGTAFSAVRVEVRGGDHQNDQGQQDQGDQGHSGD